MKWKWWLLLLLLPLAWGLSRLRLDTQVLNLLPENLPSVRGLKLYEEHFANANELLLALKGEDPAALENAAREIAARLRSHTNLVSSAVWTPPWEENPGETAELMAYLWLNQPPEVFASFVQQFAPTNLPVLLEESKTRLASSMSPNEIAKLSYDPFGFLDVPGESAASFGSGSELFVSRDGKFRIIFVQSRRPLKTFEDCQVFMARVQEIITAWQSTASSSSSAISINYTGRPAFVTEISSHMQQDIQGSVGGTLLIISALFWWTHRRFKPLLWLVLLLVTILLTTLAIGGFVFARLNIISVGFAAILLGLAVDYGMVLYQEWISSRGVTKNQLRRVVAPSIIWSAITTSAAFFILNLSGLPGLAQLGTLVGIGIVVGATVMLSFFLAPFKEATSHHTEDSHSPTGRTGWASVARVITGLILLGGIFVWFNPPRVHGGAEALRPASSPAYSTLDQIKQQFRRLDEPLWLIVPGETWDQVGARLDQAALELEKAKAAGKVREATLPGALCPRPERQRANTQAATPLVQREQDLIHAALASGFTTNSTTLMSAVLDVWNKAGATGEFYIPQQTTGLWILQRVISFGDLQKIALGIIQPSSAGEKDTHWMSEVAEGDVLIASWEQLGAEVFALLKREAWLVGVPMGLLVLTTLSLAFKQVKPILFSLLSLLLAGILLSIVMVFAGWQWNLMNFMSLPLLMGAGLDYGLHVQLSLKRHGHNVAEMRRSVGRALFLCAASTIAGFGSLAWAGNEGLASMGRICATGIASAYFVAVWLLPHWVRQPASGKVAKGS